MSAAILGLVVVALATTVAWAAGAVLFPAWALVARRLPVVGRTALVVATLPILVGVLVGVAAIVPGDPHGGTVFGCHCHTSMPMWQHLCPVHPEQAVSLLPAALVTLALVAPGRVSALWRLARQPLGVGGTGVVVARLPEPNAALVGWLRPSLVVDPRLWQMLSEPERDAVVAHERAHLARRDPWVLMALSILAVAAPAPARRQLVDAWRARSERRADAIAALTVGDPTVVAAALVRCARLRVDPSPAIGWTGRGELESRVHALLDDDGGAVSARPDVSLVDGVALAALVVACFAVLPVVHHQLEHLLNLSL